MKVDLEREGANLQRFNELEDTEIYKIAERIGPLNTNVLLQNNCDFYFLIMDIQTIALAGRVTLMIDYLM